MLMLLVGLCNDAAEEQNDAGGFVLWSTPRKGEDAIMADCGRSRYQEALNGLWAAGLRTHAILYGHSGS